VETQEEEAEEAVGEAKARVRMGARAAAVVAVLEGMATLVDDEGVVMAEAVTVVDR